VVYPETAGLLLQAWKICEAQRDREQAGAVVLVQVTVAIKDIQQGCHLRSFELKDPKDASRTMATLKVDSANNFNPFETYLRHNH